MCKTQMPQNMLLLYKTLVLHPPHPAYIDPEPSFSEDDAGTSAQALLHMQSLLVQVEPTAQEEFVTLDFVDPSPPMPVMQPSPAMPVTQPLPVCQPITPPPQQVPFDPAAQMADSLNSFQRVQHRFMQRQNNYVRRINSIQHVGFQ